MGTHVTSRRIQNIIQFIYDNKYPSKTQIMGFLNEKDFVLSARTLERDFDTIRADFGLDIAYSKSNQGYFINEENSVKVDSFFKFLELVTVADILSESLRDSHKILNYVSFDDSKYFKGIENLKDILVAISKNRKLSFIHENFELNTFKKYEITPLLLKEYENRWYVIGVPEEMTEIRTFGVDRITDISLGKTSKLKRKNFDAQINSFDNVIGLYFKDNKPLNIRLLVDELHIKYMKSLPLHKSQVIHSKNENGQSFVDFKLDPNYEFMTQILKIGSEAEVVYPIELREEIKNVLTKTLERYK
ncbi:helix-turn-helix transcriptional regulator [Yeosuana sp.]|uniref:helix-turn-helix transcriptional regulator n=1 Tax=Yeosuana sp. TaxID=2529388 RepID=UPI004054AE3B